LETPFNSEFNDIAYTEDFDGNVYITSDRDTSGKKRYQIFKIEIIPEKEKTIVKKVPIVLTGVSEAEENGNIRIIQLKDSITLVGFAAEIPAEIKIDKSLLKDSILLFTVKQIFVISKYKILDDETTNILSIEKLTKPVPVEVSEEFNTIEEVKNALDFDISYCRIQVGAFLNIISVKEFELKYPKLKGKVIMEDHRELLKFYLNEKIEKIEAAAELQKKCIQEFQSVEDTFIGVYDKTDERILIFFDVEKNKYIVLKK
jgi:hypothetical protein